MLDKDLELDIELIDFDHINDDMPNLDHLRDHVQGIVEAVYLSGDVIKLESCLDEVCSELGLPLNKREPVIRNKKEDLMSWHLMNQREMIDQLRN